MKFIRQCPYCNARNVTRLDDGPRAKCGKCLRTLWVRGPAPATIREPLVRTG